MEVTTHLHISSRLTLLTPCTSHERNRRDLVWLNLIVHVTVWATFALLLWAFFLELLPYNWKNKARAHHPRIHMHNRNQPNRPNHQRPTRHTHTILQLLYLASLIAFSSASDTAGLVLCAGVLIRLRDQVPEPGVVEIFRRVLRFRRVTSLMYMAATSSLVRLIHIAANMFVPFRCERDHESFS